MFIRPLYGTGIRRTRSSPSGPLRGIVYTMSAPTSASLDPQMAQLMEAINLPSAAEEPTIPEQQHQAESHIVAFLRTNKKAIWKDNVRSLLNQIPVSFLSKISLRALISSAPVFAVLFFLPFSCSFTDEKQIFSLGSTRSHRRRQGGCGYPPGPIGANRLRPYPIPFRAVRNKVGRRWCKRRSGKRRLQ